jgi:hypothetical protein
MFGVHDEYMHVTGFCVVVLGSHQFRARSAGIAGLPNGIAHEPVRTA